MNDFRNLGNANAALATLNFNHHDRLADEFIHWLFRLVGEDAPEALIDNYFNEARIMDTLDEILDDLPLFNNDIPRPSGMDLYFHHLASAVHAVKVEDNIAQTLVRQLQQENARLRQRSPSPVMDISDSDGYPNNIYLDEDESDLPKHPEDLIDNEAEEVPEGEESSPEPSEEASGSEGSSADSEESGEGSEEEVD